MVFINATLYGNILDCSFSCFFKWSLHMMYLTQMYYFLFFFTFINGEMDTNKRRARIYYEA